MEICEQMLKVQLNKTNGLIFSTAYIARDRIKDDSQQVFRSYRTIWTEGYQPRHYLTEVTKTVAWSDVVRRRC